MSKTIRQAIARHRTTERRRIAFVAVCLALMLVSLVLDVATGPALLPVADVVAALTGAESASETTTIIVWTLRLPMALMALVVGVALGASGATMQTLLDNVLASPYTLGLASAAGFGASLAILNGGWGIDPIVAVPGTAFATASLAAALIFALGKGRVLSGDTIILAGIALMFLFHSLQSILQFRATPEVGQQIVFWMFGTLAKASWANLAATAFTVVVALPVLMASTWRLTALRLGEDRAKALGVAVGPLRAVAMGLVSFMTATAIAFVGTIGFVGLVAPHIARSFVGEDQRFLLPASAVVGALMLSFASVLSKIVMPGVLLPVGIVTAVIGVPFFLHLLVGRARRGV